MYYNLSDMKGLPYFLNVPHVDKIALTNGVDKSEFAHFKILRTFFSIVPKIQKKVSKSTGYW